MVPGGPAAAAGRGPALAVNRDRGGRRGDTLRLADGGERHGEPVDLHLAVRGTGTRGSDADDYPAPAWCRMQPGLEFGGHGLVRHGVDERAVGPDAEVLRAERVHLVD